MPAGRLFHIRGPLIPVSLEPISVCARLLAKSLEFLVARPVIELTVTKLHSHSRRYFLVILKTKHQTSYS